MTEKEVENSDHRVFISYSNEKDDSSTSISNDRQMAENICAALESQDIRCWIAPRDILPGKKWLDAMIDAIEKSSLVILIFSSNTNKSTMVGEEITFAIQENKTIIPFRIENASLQGTFKLLRGRHWLEAYTPPLAKHIEHLITVVCRYLGIKPKKTTKDTERIIVKKQPGPGKEKIKEPGEMPEDVEAIKSKARRVYKNEKGSWEADYGDGIIMVYIPPGEFTMGSNDYDDEKPPHSVYLDGYWMGKYAVTFDQYDKYCGDTDQEKPGDREWGRGKRPVINVSWHDAAAYCDWLSKKIGLTFKLPTEAQWEKAARGTDDRTYPWGDQKPDEDLANFGRHHGKTSPVGSYPGGESPYGLLDMAGNVWEWCNDWYADDYYKNSPDKNPQGPKGGAFRVLRGGSWYNDAACFRCAGRDSDAPSVRNADLGFRLSQDNR